MQRLAPVGRHETDRYALRDDRVRGGKVLRVADCAEDAAPVRVAAVEGGLDEGVARDGGGDEFCVWEVGRVDHADSHLLRGTLPVTDDELGELEREV